MLRRRSVVCSIVLQMRTLYLVDQIIEILRKIFFGGERRVVPNEGTQHVREQR